MVTADATVGVRQRRWRMRQKNPVRSVGRIEYERDAVLEALILTGRLSETEIFRRGTMDTDDNRRAVLERLINPFKNDLAGRPRP